ncbi:hypothetical protein R9X47_20590 [Wukongibacter baidiensis]|uniref:hypothetical protein n=1 Tax=Wukongibacter baidiensis TaxID=1723361 RepID=UPI003D7F233E
MRILKQLNDDLFKEIKKEIIFGILEIAYGFACFPIMMILTFLVRYNSDYIYLGKIVFWVYILGIIVIAGFSKKHILYVYFFFTLKKKYLDYADNLKNNKKRKIFFISLILFWIYILVRLLTNNL